MGFREDMYDIIDMTDSFGDGDEDFDTFNYDEVIKTTDKAWLISIQGRRIWLPKSKCEIDNTKKVVYIPMWLTEINKLKIGD